MAGQRVWSPQVPAWSSCGHRLGAQAQVMGILREQRRFCGAQVSWHCRIVSSGSLGNPLASLTGNAGLLPTGLPVSLLGQRGSGTCL